MEQQQSGSSGTFFMHTPNDRSSTSALPCLLRTGHESHPVARGREGRKEGLVFVGGFIHSGRVGVGGRDWVGWSGLGGLMLAGGREGCLCCLVPSYHVLSPVSWLLTLPRLIFVCLPSGFVRVLTWPFVFLRLEAPLTECRKRREGGATKGMRR